MSWFSRNEWEQDANEELRFHIEQQTAANIAAGMSPEDARRQAALQFGAVEGVKEDCREQRSAYWFESLVADLRYALRMLRKSPAFAAIAILTLALGIGANTAIFSLVEGVLLAPLPYPDPHRLVMVWENNPRFPRVFVSYPNFLDWQHSARSFRKMAAFRNQGIDLTSPGTPEHIDAKQISSGFFSTLGTELSLGREFSPEEDHRGAVPVVIISYGLWRNRFDGSADVLGKSLTLDGVDYTIVGVTPKGFRLEGQADVYTPLGRSDTLVLDDRAATTASCPSRA